MLSVQERRSCLFQLHFRVVYVNGVVYAAANINNDPGSIYALRASNSAEGWAYLRQGKIRPVRLLTTLETSAILTVRESVW
jgi:hypothetical protein